MPDTTNVRETTVRAEEGRPCALFVFTAITYFREAAPVIPAFVEAGWRTTVLVGFSGRTSDDIARQCREWGATVLQAPDGIGYGDSDSSFTKATTLATGPTPAAPIVRPVTAWFRRLSDGLHLTRLLLFPRLVRNGLLIRRFADRCLADIQPDIVLCGPFHSVGQLDNAIARTCKARGVRIFCIPNSPYLGERILRVARIAHLRDGMAPPSLRANYDWINRLVAVVARRWTRVLAGGEQLFYWDPVTMMAASLCGLSMQRPWLKPSLLVDKVFVHNSFSQNLLLGDGFPREKIVVSGPPLLDSVWRNLDDQERRSQIFRHIRLDPGSPFILLNIEPSFEHSYCPEERHWTNFRDLMAHVSRCGMPVILSLHPLCHTDSYRFAESEYGVTISTAVRIHDLYPYATISVSFPCSTNLLAETFGTPLVIYDFFNLTVDPAGAEMHALPGATIGFSGAETASLIRTALTELGEAKPGSRQASATACATILAAATSGLAATARGH